MKGILTYDTWSDQLLEKLGQELKDYTDILRWTYREYGDKVLYACSFGAEAIVMLDLISKVADHPKIVFLDTGLHFKETYELIEKIRTKYPGLDLELVQPSLSLESQSTKYGAELWKSDPNLCCYLRKIKPLEEKLSTVHAWISGLRRDQSPTRKNTQFINRDERFKKIKICPLIHWTREDIWSYIRLNNLPYNELHDKSYPSIGCEKCTVPVTGSEDQRAGRWVQFNKTECGLHRA
ncbi:phosphoadenylyl-sulfate reductase [Bacillus sp. T33-2]|uniref:phosphoadenylyl-sulfate reductase n=1 Tax=Bacillus sp. T33-2 TaxID=2054168 RepID=UPI000C781451|nr:phosphoadenylyl-sulfate reductase [Bacillus sp. T33-2]PLR96829.1 phosphoadenylyl-sulfate reductase [Bacillus sp. T33-2]